MDTSFFNFFINPKYMEILPFIVGLDINLYLFILFFLGKSPINGYKYGNIMGKYSINVGKLM